MTRAKTAVPGRLQVGTVAGFKSESMADIKSVHPAGLRRNSQTQDLIDFLKSLTAEKTETALPNLPN